MPAMTTSVMMPMPARMVPAFASPVMPPTDPASHEEMPWRAVTVAQTMAAPTGFHMVSVMYWPMYVQTLFLQWSKMLNARTIGPSTAMTHRRMSLKPIMMTKMMLKSHTTMLSSATPAASPP